MAYRVADLQPGDTILVRGGGKSLPARALDAAIRWSTGSSYTHAVLVGDGVLIEALEKVTLSPLGKYAEIGDRFEVEICPYSGHPSARAIEWAKAHVGAPYGVREILLDAARFDLHWLPHVRRPLRHLTCSGLVAMAYAQSGITLTYAPWPAPSDLSYSPLLIGTRAHL